MPKRLHMACPSANVGRQRVFRLSKETHLIFTSSTQTALQDSDFPAWVDLCDVSLQKAWYARWGVSWTVTFTGRKISSKSHFSGQCLGYSDDCGGWELAVCTVHRVDCHMEQKSEKKEKEVPAKWLISKSWYREAWTMYKLIQDFFFPNSVVYFSYTDLPKLARLIASTCILYIWSIVFVNVHQIHMCLCVCVCAHARMHACVHTDSFPCCIYHQLVENSWHIKVADGSQESLFCLLLGWAFVFVFVFF